MHLSEQVGTYYVMQHKATLLSFVPTDILWEAIRDYRMDQEAKQKNETNGGKGEKRSNSVVASSGDDWDAKRQRTGTDAEDAEAVGGEVRMTGDEKAVDGEGRENSCGLLDLGIEAAIAECKIGMQSSTSAGSFLQDAPQLRSLGPVALPLTGIVLYFVINEAAPILDLWLLFFEAQSSNFSICQGAFRHYRTTPCASTRTLGL